MVYAGPYPNAEFTVVPKAGHFIALERPDVLANLLNSVP
jgi:pimeloyl-ACP methyl ester carboxylesterase